MSSGPSTSRPAARRLRWKPLLVGVALLAACGGGSSTRSAPTTSTQATSSTTTAAPVTATRCHAGQLQLSFGTLGAGAGQRYTTLVLTNTGSTCQTIGYVGLQLLGPGRQSIPTLVNRVAGSPVSAPATVTLAPGGRASTQLHWGGIPLSDEPQTGACEPTPNQVEVTPPNETQFLVATWTFGSVCEHGSIDAQPLVAGVPSP